MENEDELRQQITRLRAENAELRQVIDELLLRLYGKKSERHKPAKDAPAQIDSPSEATTATSEKSKAAAVGHGRTAFPEHLPRELVMTDVPASDRRCSVCEKELISIGEDECERGHVEPVRITIRRYVSKKYGCPDGHEVKQAKGTPEGLVPRAKWTTETYAFVVTQKYGDHMPLDRLESTLKRRGIALPKSTMSDMILVVSDKCEPIIEQMRRELLAEKYIQADETPLQYAIESGNQREVKQGYFWAWGAQEKLLLEFDPSREGDNAKRFLGDWCGTLQADGYKGYNAVVEENKITRAGCTSHVRRKFNAAAELKQPGAQEMLTLMRRLYWIESAIKKRVDARRLSAKDAEELTRRVRHQRSRAQMTKIDRCRQKLADDPTILPKSPLGKAVAYMTNQWESLQVFIEQPEVNIDNNAIERAIRPIAIGRKNWMLAGSPRGARAAARLYSIIHVCKALDIDPYVYLSDVLEKVSPNARLEDLTPWAWKKANAAHGATPTT